MTIIHGDGDGRVVIDFPKPPKSKDAVIKLVSKPWEGCKHLRAELDEALAELTCADCQAKLNPYEFLKRLSHQETQWGWQWERLQEATAKAEQRTRCTCEHCGQQTRIRTIGRREVARIKGRK